MSTFHIITKTTVVTRRKYRVQTNEDNSVEAVNRLEQGLGVLIDEDEIEVVDEEVTHIYGGG